MKISFRQLQVFVFTAKYGAISEAANHCYISQPAASMALQQLESFLEAPLFERVGKRLRLNNNGKRLLPKATAILDQVNELESANTEGLQGELSIGASLTIGNFILPHYLQGFKQQYPQVTLTTMTGNTQKIIEELLALNLDFGLIEGECEHPSIEVTPWREDELVIIANKSHPLAQRKQLRLEDLSKYPWVMREAGSGTQALVCQSLKGKVDYKVEIVLTSFEAIMQYVERGECLSVVSKAALNLIAKPKLSMLPIKNFSITRKLYLITHRQKYQSNVSEAFQAYTLKNTS